MFFHPVHQWMSVSSVVKFDLIAVEWGKGTEVYAAKANSNAFDFIPSAKQLTDTNGWSVLWRYFWKKKKNNLIWWNICKANILLL